MNLYIVDDSQEIRSALMLFIAQETPWVVSGEAGSLLGGLAELGQLAPQDPRRPDIILLDAEIQGLPPSRDANPYLDLVSLLRQICPRAKVIGWSTHESNKRAALEAGMAGFICKTDPPQSIFRELSRMVQGRG